MYNHRNGLDAESLHKIRRILIMLLGTLEDALGVPRSVPSKDERRAERRKTKEQA